MIILLTTEQNNCDYHFSHYYADLLARKYLELRNSMNKLKCVEYVKAQYL